jgi:superfamily II DNA or RNA helicase
MGKKWLGNTNHRENEEYEHARLISIMINVPRMRQLLAVATLVKSKGEKLVIFDVNQFFIIHMLIFFKYHGFDIYPFCTEYNPQSRVKMLEKFKTHGDILIGSIEMLGEGLNIVEANHIAFARYPSTTEEFIQAFGRCHRYPQKKTVYVHMVFSCRLEMFSATQALEGFRKRIKVFRHLAELNEIYDKAEKHKPLPPSLKPHELRLEDYLVKK